MSRSVHINEPKRPTTESTEKISNLQVNLDDHHNENGGNNPPESHTQILMITTRKVRNSKLIEQM